MSTNTPMSNDFGNMHSPIKVYGKYIVEDRISIKISDLIRTDAWEQRDDPELKELPEKFKIFKMSGIEMQLMKDPIFSNWYVDLVNPGLNCFFSAISLIATRCRLGGFRYWFQCPNDDCQKKVMVLYKDHDDFRCRKCLNLDYRSHQINYKSLEPAINYMNEFKGMNLNFRRTYKGKDTKKMKRFWKLKAKARMGFDVYGPRYEKLARETD